MNIHKVFNKISKQLVVIIIFLNCDKIKCIDDLSDENSIKVSLSHGFIGYKTIDLIRKKITATDDNIKKGLANNILICLAKLNFKFESYSDNFSKVISIKPINYNYNLYYIVPGCISEYPGPKCIMRRVGICSIGYGFEYYMKATKNILSQNVMFYINIIGKKILPFDFILSYSPLVISLNCGLYFDFNLINFSLGSFIKGIIMSTAKLEKHYKKNWEITDDDDSDYKSFKQKYKDKVNSIQRNTKNKLKYVFVESILMNIINNMQLFIGIKFNINY